MFIGIAIGIVIGSFITVAIIALITKGGDE